MRGSGTAALAGLAALACLAVQPASAWDSAKFETLTKIVHPTHSYLTEYAIGQLAAEYPELKANTKAVIDGANTELHELPVSGTMYGVDLEAKRKLHKGTNEGSDDVPGWWADALSAYRAGRTEQAYFYVGVMLHMIEDLGVPAHANHIHHEGNLTDFDNFELMALQGWDPDFSRVNRTDPGFENPSGYYVFSGDWAHADAPDYADRDSFSKFWFTASSAEKRLVRDRQARTASVTVWALRAAMKAFQAP